MNDPAPRYLIAIPSTVTLLGVLGGFLAILWAPSSPYAAGCAIIGASLCDMIDGRLARLTRTSSPFGMQLDSLADIVSFGVAPAHLAVCWSLTPTLSATLPFSPTWLVAFLYVAACAVRLARFNLISTATDEAPGFHMIGLPSPVAALTITTLVMTTYELPWPWLAHLRHPAVVLPLLLLLGVLMVTRLPFPSYKRFKSRPRQLAFFVAIASGLTLLIAGGPGGAVLCALLSLYIVVGAARALTA